MKSVEQVVQDQIDFYNANDLDNFSKMFDGEVEVFDLPSGELKYIGRDVLYERYKETFSKNPHARISKRIIHENKVIDHEFFMRDDMASEEAVVVIYEVQNELITRVWFMR